MTIKSLNWFECKKAFGKVVGLDHPPTFKKNIYGIAGHWKINRDLVSNARIGWFDPFSGWGESLLLAAKLGINYLGNDINSESLNDYILPYILPETETRGAVVRCFDSTKFDSNLVGKFDLCYTSPPYFDFEEYSSESDEQIKDCDTYDKYHEKITTPVFTHVKEYLIDDGVLALQVEKDKNKKEKWKDVIISLGYKLINDTTQGTISNYSKYAKADQSLLVFKKD